ncbi:hypothetical protein Tco_0262333 [Tanacetum coccineum]
MIRAKLEDNTARLKKLVLLAEVSTASRQFPFPTPPGFFVMSSASSAVTYTSVYTDSEPGRAFREPMIREISDGAHDPDYVPEPIHPEYVLLEDDNEFPAEEHHYLLLIHPLLSHPHMLLSRILRRIYRSTRMMRQRMVSYITASQYGLAAGRFTYGDRMTLQETATHQELQTHRDHVYAHETHLQVHQTQLQLQGTLIQTQHQVHETRFQMQQAELAALRETDRRRQDQMVETLRVIRDMRREMSNMQAELLSLREQ